MTAPAPAEVDVEWTVRALLEQYTGITTVTETDADLGDELPLLQVARIGGSDDGVVLDRATISIHAYGATRDLARKAAYQARTALYAARGLPYHGAVITRVATIGGPAWTPYANTNLRRVTGTYQVFVKATQ